MMVSDDVNDLDYFVWLLYVFVGKMFDSKMFLSVVVDLISGDNDSSDNKSLVFDGLYGVR